MDTVVGVRGGPVRCSRAARSSSWIIALVPLSIKGVVASDDGSPSVSLIAEMLDYDQQYIAPSCFAIASCLGVRMLIPFRNTPVLQCMRAPCEEAPPVNLWEH